MGPPSYFPYLTPSPDQKTDSGGWSLKRILAFPHAPFAAFFAYEGDDSKFLPENAEVVPRRVFVIPSAITALGVTMLKKRLPGNLLPLYPPNLNDADLKTKADRWCHLPLTLLGKDASSLDS